MSLCCCCLDRQMCDFAHPSVTWLMPLCCCCRERQMCDMTHPYVWHDSSICVTWLSNMCDMTHPYAWHDSRLCTPKRHGHASLSQIFARKSRTSTLGRVKSVFFVFFRHTYTHICLIFVCVYRPGLMTTGPGPLSSVSMAAPASWASIGSAAPQCVCIDIYVYACMCVCMYVCMRVYICVHICKYVYMGRCIVSVDGRAWIYGQRCWSVRVYRYTHVCLYVCKCVCVYTYVHICKYVFVQTFTHMQICIHGALHPLCVHDSAWILHIYGQRCSWVRVYRYIHVCHVIACVCVQALSYIYGQCCFLVCALLCVCVCVYVSIYVYIHIYTYVYLYIYMYIPIHMCTYVYIRIYTYVVRSMAGLRWQTHERILSHIWMTCHAHEWNMSYGVALVSRIDKIIGLLCKRAL